MRFENGTQSAANVFEFDVYLYNTGSAAFELRAGTISFWINPSWRNSGTITSSIVSSNLVTAQQGGTSGYTNGSTDFFRRTIPYTAAGAGTSISAGSRTKLFTIRFTNSASFSSSAMPNFAWKFSGSNAAGFSFTDTSTSASAIAVNATTVTTTQANCFTPAFYNGTGWSTGSTTAGSASTTAPNGQQDAVIVSGTLSGGLSCRSYSLVSGATHNLGSSTLEVSYNLQNNGTLSASQGTLHLNGTQAKQTSTQTVSGSGFTVANLIFGNSSSGGTKSINCAVSVGTAVTQSGSSQLQTNGNLTLLSNATRTAYIGALNTGGDISGSITVERYIPASYRRYRFLASPVVGGTTLQWRNNGVNTSGRGIQITHNTGVRDTSNNNMPSAFLYNEASTSGGTDLNQKWESIDGNTALANGKGYRVFVRGDRTRSLTSNSDTSANETTIWVSGSYAGSPVNINLTYNAGLGEGWNLVGNPYPATIDWDAASGWTKTHISNTIYIWNVTANSFGTYDGLTAVNGCTRYISSGQAFFVKANASGASLNLTESVKVTNAGSELFKTSELNTLRITLMADSNERDETVIRFYENRSKDYMAGEDVLKYLNPGLNLGTAFPGGIYGMVNYLPESAINNSIVALMSKPTVLGTYKLNFSGINKFDGALSIKLVDKYAGKTEDLRSTATYTFETNSDPASYADGRFEVHFGNTANGVSGIGSTQNILTVYPNPAKEYVNVNLEMPIGQKALLSIIHLSGKEVHESLISKGNSRIDVSGLEEGVYLMKVVIEETGEILVKTLIR